ncbi:MAG: hypothetical protein WA931_09830 [Rhodococcus sp. (in: high G+C Gram-positive bacteria)]
MRELNEDAPDAGQGVEGDAISSGKGSIGVEVTALWSHGLNVGLTCDMSTPAGLKCTGVAACTATVHAWPCAMTEHLLCTDCAGYYLDTPLPLPCTQCGVEFEVRTDLIHNVVTLGGVR